MQFLDHGQLALLMQNAIGTPEAMAMMKQAGYNEEVMKEAIATINDMTPFSFAATYFVNHLLIGLVLSLPIAFVMKKNNIKQ